MRGKWDAAELFGTLIVACFILVVLCLVCELLGGIFYE